MNDKRSRNRLEHFPISFFATVMGTTGLAIAWQKAHAVLDAPPLIGQVLSWCALALFALLVLIYAAKWAGHPAAVRAELAHPVKLNFFPATSISLLLLSVAFLADLPALAKAFWLGGAALHLAFTLYVMNSWIHHTHYQITHANPAWFIPVVGNVIVPVAGVNFAPAELSWFFFSIGIVFWLALFTIVLYRLFFHEPLPARLTPTLFILIAPPAVGFIAYLKLAGELDAFARILYYMALFLTLLLASNAARFFRLPFFLSAWAYSFPLAAITIATLAMTERVGGAFTGLALVLLGVLSLVLALLTVRTVMAIGRGEICQPE
jgi:tellurite resistance protein